ncbi:helix-turn-helix domain-containing protein [Planotetraspora sp. GP83]|uniref:helix-turn-helix domain-containing protein n=1 Tax=Planotetraspora sp. GP83 TaxID=3156264 RepID=UPI0035119EAC
MNTLDVKFLTVAEVATVMRVSKMTVYRLVRSGELPHLRVGRVYRVPEQEVIDYLSRRTRGARDRPAPGGGENHAPPS